MRPKERTRTHPVTLSSNRAASGKSRILSNPSGKVLPRSSISLSLFKHNPLKVSVLRNLQLPGPLPLQMITRLGPLIYLHATPRVT